MACADSICSTSFGRGASLSWRRLPGAVLSVELRVPPEIGGATAGTRAKADFCDVAELDGHTAPGDIQGQRAQGIVSRCLARLTNMAVTAAW